MSTLTSYAGPPQERLHPPGGPGEARAGGGVPLIQLKGVTKTYGQGPTALQALKGVDLQIEAGDFVAVMGPSGSGKSTAMNTLGCLDTPTTGEYLFNGNRIFVRDSSITFQGNQLDPIFDVTAETSVRVPGQTINVRMQLAVTFNTLSFRLCSDPHLDEADIVTLLFGGTPRWGVAEQRALG